MRTEKQLESAMNLHEAEAKQFAEKKQQLEAYEQRQRLHQMEER